jgi:ADP-heptose:LPS heptosyltransferase
MRQITVVRPGALGDTLLALPALALLRIHFPDTRLSFIARADVVPLVQAMGLADDAWPWDASDWAALFKPAASAADLTPRARVALVNAYAALAWVSDTDGALATVLQSLSIEHIIVTPGRPDENMREPGEHIALWLARALRPLGIIPPEDLAALRRALGRLRWPDAAERSAQENWESLALPERDVIAIHPGSGGATKRWAPASFAALTQRARQANYTPLLLAGEADAEVVAATQAAAPTTLPVAQGLDVATLAALLARCAGYVGNDSGVSHLAGLLGVPTVALFGPTNPARWTPLGPRVTTVRAPDSDLAQLAPDIVWRALRETMEAMGEERRVQPIK